MRDKKHEHINSTPEKETVARLTFTPKNDEQIAALECCQENEIVFLTGPAGTAKTYIATYFAINGALEDDYRKVFISRPAVTQGADIGWLKGSAEDKMKPFIQPIIDSYSKQAGYDKGRVNAAYAKTEILPLCYVRGRTIEKSVLIVDEAQNMTGREIWAVATRLGLGGKIIFCGDVTQTDIRHAVLREAAEDLSKISRGRYTIGWHEFTSDAIVRHPLVCEMVQNQDSFPWAA